MFLTSALHILFGVGRKNRMASARTRGRERHQRGKGGRDVGEEERTGDRRVGGGQEADKEEDERNGRRPWTDAATMR
jgi:hypothetical protein